jgi:hypothetical protein
MIKTALHGVLYPEAVPRGARKWNRKKKKKPYITLGDGCISPGSQSAIWNLIFGIDPVARTILNRFEQPGDNIYSWSVYYASTKDLTKDSVAVKLTLLGSSSTK